MLLDNHTHLQLAPYLSLLHGAWEPVYEERVIFSLQHGVLQCVNQVRQAVWQTSRRNATAVSTPVLLAGCLCRPLLMHKARHGLRPLTLPM